MRTNILTFHVCWRNCTHLIQNRHQFHFSIDLLKKLVHVLIKPTVAHKWFKKQNIFFLRRYIYIDFIKKQPCKYYADSFICINWLISNQMLFCVIVALFFSLRFKLVHDQNAASPFSCRLPLLSLVKKTRIK